MGADYRFSSDLLLGLLGQLDWTDEHDDTVGTSASGLGWMVGPYVVAKLTDTLIFDGRAAWGMSENEVDALGLFTDNFDTTRWLIRGQLTGDYQIKYMIINPFVRLSYFEEQQKAYTDTLGNLIPSQTISLAQLKFGPKLSARITAADGTTVTPHLTISGIWDFDQPLQTVTQGVAIGNGGIRGRVEGGVAITMPHGQSINFEGFYDGIGSTQLEAYGGSLSISMPLH